MRNLTARRAGILAVMSLAVHGAGAVAPVFNATFYATGATVIPVLFLALAVQGRGFGELLRAATTAREEAAANKRRDPVLLFPPRVLLAAAWVIMAAGVVGEGVAMWDLYFGSASGLDGITVLAATLVLLLAVVTGPLLAFNMILAGRTAERIRRRREAAAPEPETPAAS
jgi:hypothetical protein